MIPIVLDNSVLIDLILEEQNKSRISNLAYQIIIKKAFHIHLPSFAIFEIQSAIRNRKTNLSEVKFDRKILINEHIPLKLHAIDDEFIKNNIEKNIGYLKAADYVYVCLAPNYLQYLSQKI